MAEVVYGVRPSRRDPARYSFAHGGKDGHPFPVNRQDYDRSINMLETALGRLRKGDPDVMRAFKRLSVIQSGLERSFGAGIGNYAMWITFAILEELPTFGVAPGLLTGRGEWFNPGCMIFGYNSL
ncbi:MAG: DUF763 domain-containing protein [Bacillota bacterium]